MTKDERIIELLEYMIARIADSNENTLLQIEVDQMYEMLHKVKNTFD